MKKLEQRVPNLRFKGFTNDWEQHKLEEMAEIVRGASPRPIKDKKWFDSNSTIGWIRISDVTAQNGRIYHLSQHISKLGQQKTRVVIQPHLLLSIAASVGYPVINYIPTGVHDGFLIFNNPKFNINYMFYWLRKYQTNWKKYGQPGSQVNLNSSIVSNTKVRLPSLDEQATISNIFYQIDKILSLQQRKLDLLKQLKKGLLQKMFADKDSKQPILRFKGFHDDWEQRKGKSIFYSKSNKDFPELTVLSATQDKGMIPRSSTGIDIKYEKKSLRGYKKIEPGDFVVHLRSFQGGFAYSDLTGIVSPAYTVFTFKQPEMFNNYFWKEKFTSYNFIQLLKKVTYGVRDGRSISYSDFLTLNEKFPVKVEQTKIADLFKIIDNLITLQQQKLAKYQSIKKSLLQQMFI